MYHANRAGLGLHSESSFTAMRNWKRKHKYVSRVTTFDATATPSNAMELMVEFKEKVLTFKIVRAIV
jgi:hypothetical protein